MLSSQGDLIVFSQGDLIGKTTGQNFLTVWFCQQWVGGTFLLSLIVIIPSHHLHHILISGMVPIAALWWSILTHGLRSLPGSLLLLFFSGLPNNSEPDSPDKN